MSDTPPAKPPRRREQIQIAVWCSRALVEKIDERVAEKQKGRMKKINRSDVIRELLHREFGVEEAEE